MLYQPTLISLFSGCGGMDYGFDQAGIRPIWANEIDKDASRSYKNLLKEEIVVDDIWNVLDTIPNGDIVIGGPPCQSFSLVGKRLEDDPRGKLVFAFERAIEKIRPKAFVMENVPGLAASQIDGQRLHLYLAKKFYSMGYEVSVQKLDASDYYVPQRRKRIVIIGINAFFSNFLMIDNLNFSQLLGEESLKVPVSVSEALRDLPSPSSKDLFALEDYNSEPDSPYSRLMRKGNGNTVSLQTLPTMSALDREFVKHIPPGGNYEDIPDDISTKRILKFKDSGGRTTTYGRLHPDRPAFTINTYFNRPNVGSNYHYREARLITPREALRLQSFPDSFTPEFSTIRSLHQQIGNAVPPLLARAIAESLKRAMRGNH